MRSNTALLLCQWILLSLRLLLRANEAIYHLERAKCDIVKAFLFFLRGIPSGVDAYQSFWAIGRGNCFDNRFLPCPWEAHIPYWPHRGQGHPDCVLQPSPSIPSSRHPLFTCCPGDCTATKTTHCCVENGNEMAYNPPNDHTKDRYSVNISMWD